MWKAFEEMEILGWVEQAANARRCTPSNPPAARPSPAPTLNTNPPASFSRTPPPLGGLRVPKPYADAIILDIVRESGGGPSQARMNRSSPASSTGPRTKASSSLPKAAATTAYDRLIATGELMPTDKVVLFNTGAGLKYTDMTAEAMHLVRPGILPTSMPVGGIITPQ